MSPAAILAIQIKTAGLPATTNQLQALDKNARKAGVGIQSAEGHAKRSSKTFSALGSAAKGTGALLGAAGLAAGVKSAVSEFREAQKVGAQTNAVLKSTKGAAKVTATEIQNLAGAISKKTGIDDEQIQASENMLLTFTKVRNETGKGNKIFDQATQVVTDMSVALGQSGKSSALQLGKALNDPIKGVTALQRVGVSFTASQKESIKTMVATGDRLGAQKLILRELRTEFAGSAAAQATAGDKFKVSLGNIAEAAGAILVPALDKVMAWFTRLMNQMVTGVGVGGALISKFREFGGVLAPLGQSIGVIVGWLRQHSEVSKVLAIGLGGLAAAVIAVNVAMSLNPFVLAAAALAALVVGVVTAYREFSTFRNIVNAVVGAVGSALPTIAAIARGAMAAFTAVFRAAWPVIRAIFSGGITALKGIVTGGAQILSGAVQVIKGVLKGDFGQIWDGIKAIFRGGFTALKGIITGAAGALGAAAKAIGTAIIDAIVGAIKAAGSKIVDAVKGILGSVKGAVGGALGAINPFGDGLGFKPIAPLPTGPAGSLMGARPTLAPFARVGAGFGLHVSSGMRPGARTALGASYHSTGEAIDLANGRGPDAAKMGAFRALRSRFGSRLAELIYTPGGVGIKDGKPYTYTGKVARDHFDHVHVAFDTGMPGVGDGVGKAAGRAAAFMGDGPGHLSGVNLAIDAARKAGFKGTDLVNMIAIAGRESSYSPSAHNYDPPRDDSWGLWQINVLPNANPRFKSWHLSDPYVNARAARSLFSSAGLRPWMHKGGPLGGTNVPAARAAVNAFKGGSAAGGSNAASGAASAAQKVNPFDQKIASADLAIEQAKRTKVKPGAPWFTTRSVQQAQAMTAKRKLIGARIRSIRKALAKKGLSRPKQLALTQELTQRLQEHAQLGTEIADLRKPVAADTTGAGAGGAGGDIGAGSGDTSDPNQPLIDALAAAAEAARIQAEAEKEHTDALNAAKDEIKRQTDFAASATASSNYQAWKALADILSGQIGGRGVVGRSYTPGSGVEHSY